MPVRRGAAGGKVNGATAAAEVALCSNDGPLRICRVRAGNAGSEFGQMYRALAEIRL